MVSQNKPIIDIWGSCVSREILNYGDKYQVGSYIMQNPPHTLDGQAYELPDDEIIGSSKFIIRMAKLALQKNARQYFLDNFKGQYIIVDNSDCRLGVCYLDDNPKIRLPRSITIEKTVNNLKNSWGGVNVSFLSNYNITGDEWDAYIKNFCDLLLSKYPQDHIILNEFSFADYYLEDGKLVEFANTATNAKANELIKKIDGMVKKYIPHCLVIEPVDIYISDPNHHLELSPLHYLSEIYRIQNCKLEALLEISQMQDEYKKFTDNLKISDGKGEN